MASESYRAPPVAQSAELADQQGDARAQFEAWHCEKFKTRWQTGAPTRDMHNGVHAEKYGPAEQQVRWEAWQAAWQAALAARQTGAQVPTAWLIEWKNGVTALTKVASEAEAHRECRNCTVVPVYAAPPAQGIDLGQFRGWLCTTTDGVATDWTMEEDSRARFERMGRTIEPIFAAGPDVQGTRQDHLLDRRNRLMNSYGNGDREDAAVDAQIAQVDAELALIDSQRDEAPGAGQ